MGMMGLQGVGWLPRGWGGEQGRGKTPVGVGKLGRDCRLERVRHKEHIRFPPRAP